MKTISKPTFKVRTVFLDTISTVEDKDLKKKLTDCVDIIEDAETDFEGKFTKHEIYLINQHDTILGDIGKKEMKTVYDYRMVKPTMPGNKYYTAIKSSAPFGKCPLCSIRLVDTLDHYLPKSKFPVFSVTPINLIPACTPCNKGKLVENPENSIEQTLHPYYDNIENESWIKADVIQTNPISFNFSVSPPSTAAQILKDRTINHFSAFNLNDLFSSHANEEFRGIKKQLEQLYRNNPVLLTEHLTESYTSRLELGVNSWQAVMYHALLNDSWFCSGGVLN